MKKKVLKKKLPAKKPVAKKTVKKAVVKKTPAKKAKPKLSPEKITHNVTTGYLGGLFGGDFAKHVDAAVKVVSEFRKKHPFDSIAFTGTSGAGMAFPLSYVMKVPLIHLPKPGVYRHDYSKVEGTRSSKKYLIVDDFIGGGSTVKRIEKTITDEIMSKPEPVGIFLYEGPNTGSSRKMTLGKFSVPIFTLPTPAPYYAQPFVR
jgi:hypothetical protein